MQATRVVLLDHEPAFTGGRAGAARLRGALEVALGPVVGELVALPGHGCLCTGLG